MRFKQTKDGTCYFFSPKVLHVTSSKNRLLVLWYLLSKRLFVQKEMRGSGQRLTGKEGVGKGRRNEGRKQKEGKSREKTQREREMMEGRKLIQGNFFY